MPRTDLEMVTADAREVSRRLAQAEDNSDWASVNVYQRALDKLLERGAYLTGSAGSIDA